MNQARGNIRWFGCGLLLAFSMVCAAQLQAAAPALQAGANNSVRIELLDVVRSDEIAGVRAPEGMEAVVLVTRWENVHPKQSLERAQAEGEVDRSYGAGGLTSGGSSPDAKDMVEMDVAYKVPKAGLHLWLVTRGETHALRPESKGLPNGIGPDDPFAIALRKARGFGRSDMGEGSA